MTHHADPAEKKADLSLSEKVRNTVFIAAGSPGQTASRESCRITAGLPASGSKDTPAPSRSARLPHSPLKPL
jgi:hypothetical protein